LTRNSQYHIILQMSKPARIAAPAPQSDPLADDPAAVAEAELLAASVARVERRLALLDQLAEMAMKMASRVAERALADDATPAGAGKNEAPPASGAADDLAKLSRALRITLDLAGRLEETLRTLRSGEAKLRETRRKDGELRAGRAVIDRGEAVTGRVIDQVSIAIRREAESEGDCCDLLEALEERLNDDVAYLNIDGTPLREIVEKLCGDLGLSPDWSGWTDEGWPEPPRVSFAAHRSPWSPFNRPSRTPLLYKNRDYERPEFDPIKRSP
jgi:hypothetical protein